ncbi:hypothetical protein SMC26_01905 [Actinomadura fulvescens]|uniref:Uncharacterized protein n=1 Tax=Actinomadura fulvescens TaxID=46160 RepID=A0ABN3PLT3_9ACTN
MRRRLPDLSTTQVVASGLATLAAAWGASYLGVYGTILGAAFMSVASTAGAAVCKHYLDQGKQQLQDMTHLQDEVRGQEAARGAAARATSADPTRTMIWPGDADPNATRVDGLPTFGDGDPNVTRVDRPPAETVANTLATQAGDQAVKEAAWRAAFGNTKVWLRQRWMVLAVSSAAVFALVLGGITVFEWRTGDAFGNSDGRVYKAFTGGDDSGKPSERPTRKSNEPSTKPSTTPSGTPSGEPTQPSPSTSTPSTTPTSPAPSPTPSTQSPAPAPSNSTPGGGEQGGGPRTPPAQENDPNTGHGSG